MTDSSSAPSLSPQSYGKSIVFLTMGALAIGMAPILVRLTVTQGGVGSIAAGFWRMSIGAIGFALIGFFSSGEQSPRFSKSLGDVFRNARIPALLAGAVFALDLISWHISFEYTSVANSTLLANLSSLIVPVCGVILFKEPLRRSLIVGGAFAIFGVFLLVWFGHAPKDISHSDFKFLGDALAFLTAFFYASYMLLTKHLAKHLRADALMLVVSAVSGGILLLASLILDSNVLPDTTIGWAWVLCLGLVPQVIGQGLVAKALTKLPVSISALMLLSAPVSSAIFGFLILGQEIQGGQFMGIALTLIGIAIVARRR